MKNGLTEKFVKSGVIRAEDKEIYAYGFRVAVHTIIGYVLMAVIAGLLRAWDIFLIFLPGYLPLRRYAGGFHENTRFKCMLVSQFMFVFTVFAVRFAEYAHIHPMITAAVMAAASVVILIKAPIASVNKPISDKASEKYRKISLIILTIVISIIGIFLMSPHTRPALVLTLALFIEAVLLLIPERIQK